MGKSKNEIFEFSGDLAGRQPVVEPCDGCARIFEFNDDMYCQTYPTPAAKWRLGKCNFATHVKEAVAIDQVKLNPLKASKRGMAGR